MEPPTKPDSNTAAVEAQPLSPFLEEELARIGAEGADRLLNVIRGLFHCVTDLNARVADLETRMKG